MKKIYAQIYSPNYPLSIPGQQTCQYILTANEGTRASLIFHKFNCQGASLAVYDGQTEDQPFITSHLPQMELRLLREVVGKRNS
ncbi:hypothetical protein PMAYCL1PPCAC_05481, partial [Pristionchus mayeri]